MQRARAAASTTLRDAVRAAGRPRAPRGLAPPLDVRPLLLHVHQVDFADGDVHKYFSPYASPYDAYIAYSNALYDLALRAGRRGWRPPRDA